MTSLPQAFMIVTKIGEKDELAAEEVILR